MVKKTIKQYCNFILAIFLVITFTYCSQSDDKLTLATFSNGSVNFDEYLDHYLLSTQYKPDNFPTLDNLKEIVQNKALEKMSYTEAVELNIDQDSLYQKVLRNNERRLLYQRYIQEQFTNKIITDSLIKKFYNEFTPQFKIKYIMRPFLRTSSNSFIESQQQTINKAYAELLKGKSFESVVEKYSQDIASNKKGGDIGWVIRESLGDEQLRLVMDTLSTQKFSKPFKGYGGFYIMLKGEKRDVKVPPFESVKNNIWKTLYRSRKAYIEDEVTIRFEELAPKYNFTELSENISKIISKSASQKNISDSTPLEFDKLNQEDKQIKIASYNGGFILVDDLFADSKKAPTNKSEFYIRLGSISQQHIFAKHAKEINIQNIPDLKNQIDLMKTSLLSSILYKKFVKDPTEEQLVSLKGNENFNIVKKRTEIEKKLREEFEAKLNSKFNFQFVSSNFDEALKIAKEKKEEQNRLKQKVS